MRIDGLSVPQTARASVKSAKNAIVARAEVAVSRKPATSGPSGAASSEIVLLAVSTRPSSRSGVTAIR